VNRIRAWLLGRRVQQAVDAIKEQAVRPVPVASDANDLQEYLEGGSRQQDAAALRMDRRLCATGQMTIARFRELHPELFREESPILHLDPEPVRPEPRFCHHPDAVTVTGPLRGVTEVSCPVCPARAYAQWPTVPTLLPWLIPTTGTTPPDCNGGA
jgi:hypothetical protein